MKNLWLDRSLFENPYHLTLCTTEKQYVREIKKLGIPKAERPAFFCSSKAHASVHFFENKDAGLAAIVCLSKIRDKTIHQINALIVHEAVHVWQEVKDAIGEKTPSPEFEAYAIQSISQVLMTEFERQTK